jgi:regulatory protein
MKYPPLETLERMKKWCDRQELAHGDARKKLAGWGVFGEQAESIIAELISEGFLNEERFARAFARGKNRMNGWGWKKIEAALRVKGVSSYSITLAKEEIDPSEYQELLKQIIRKKTPALKGGSAYEKRMKLLQYLAGKGYAFEEVRQAWEDMGWKP